MRFAVAEDHRPLALFQGDSSPSPGDSNFAAQDDDSVTLVYWTAPDCGATQPYRFADLNSGAHFLLNQTSSVQERPFDNSDRKLPERPVRIINKFVDHKRGVFAKS